MIVERSQITHALAAKATEFRFPAEYPHPPEEGVGELAPVRAGQGKEPVFWVHVTNWFFDDDTDEYVVEFRKVPAPDVPRLLMPAARPKGSELGYTDKAYLSLRDEPECVDVETAERFARDGRERDERAARLRSKRAQRDRELLSLEERMVNARRAARMNEVDVHAELRVLRKFQMQSRSPAAIDRQLKLLEGRAFRDAA